MSVAACSSSLRRLLPACRSNLCRQYTGNKMVGGFLIRNSDVELLNKEDPISTAYYGKGYRFLPLTLEGLDVTSEAEGFLTAPVQPADIEILPSGELLVSVEECCRRLNKAFGEQSWNVTAVSDVDKECDVDFVQVPLVEYALFVNRKFVAQAFGHAATPLSAAGKQALAFISPELRRKLGGEARRLAFQRCCRELLIGNELSMESFAKKWRAKHAHRVEEKRLDSKRTVWRRVASA